MFARMKNSLISIQSIKILSNGSSINNNSYMKNNTRFSGLKSFFSKQFALVIGLTMVVFAGVGQSNHTVNFSGNSTDFNANELYSAQGSGQNVNYYVTFDATNLYIGAFRTNSSTFGSTDNLTVYIDNVPNATPTTGSGTTTGYSYNGVTGSLPISASYAVHVEQSYQEMRTYSSGWGAANTGITVYTTAYAREVKLPWSSLGSPNSIYLTMWMGYANGMYANAPGTNVSASTNPSISGYFGGFGVSSAGCIPVNSVNVPITDSYTGTTPLSTTTYGKVTLTGAINLTNNTVTVAPGGSLIIASGATLATQSGKTINMGSGTSITNNSGSSTILANLTATLNFNLSANYTTGTTVSYINGSSTTTFPTTVTTNLNTGVDFGASSNSTISGTLNIDAGGYVSTNPPAYASTSTLAYNSGTTYTVGTEWTAGVASGAGVPQTVTIGATVANTVLSFGSGSSYHQVLGNLTISSATAGNGLILSSVSGGDLYLGGNFTASGTSAYSTFGGGFNGNGRAIFFTSTGANQIVTGPAAGNTALVIPYVVFSSATITANRQLQLGAPLVISAPSGGNAITFYNGSTGTYYDDILVNGYALTLGTSGTNFTIAQGTGGAGGSNFIIKGSGASSPTSSLTIYGNTSSPQTISNIVIDNGSGSTNFQNLTLSGVNFTLKGGSTGTGSVSVGGNSGSLSITSGSLVAGSGGLNVLAATGSITLSSGSVDASTNSPVITFNGTAAQTIPSGFFNSSTCYKLTINNSTGVTLSQSFTVTSTLTLTSGTLALNGSTLTLANNSAPSITSGNLDASASSSKLTFTNSNSVTLPAALFTSTVYNLTLNGSGGITLGASTTIANSLTLTSGTLTVGAFTLTFGASSVAPTLTSGNINASNASAIIVFTNTSNIALPASLFTGNVNSLTLSGAGGVKLGSTTTVASTLTLTTGTLSLNGNNLTLANNSAPTVTSGNIDASASSSTITFTNTSSVTLPSSLFTGNVYNLTINGSGGITLGAALTIPGTLTLTSGALNNTTYNITMVNASTITVTAGTMTAVPNFGSSSTDQVNVTYSNTSAINTGNELPVSPTPGTIGTVTFSGSSTVALQNIMTVSGSVIINSGTLDTKSGSNYNINLKGNWQFNGGTLTLRNNTVTFNGSGSPVISGSNSNFYKLVTSGTASVTTGVTTTISNTLVIGDGTSFTVSGGTFTASNTTTIGGGTSGSLVISGGTPTFTGAVTVAAGASWTNSGNTNVSFGNNLTNNSTSANFAAGTGTYTFTNASPTLAGTMVIPSLTVTAGSTLTNNGTITVGTTLTASGTSTTWTQGTNSSLTLGGTYTFTSLGASANTNTVNYSGASQTVVGVNYSSLTLSGSGTDLLQSGTTTISGNLALSGTVTTTTVVGLAVTGTLTVGDGTTLNIGGYVFSVGGTTTIGGGTSGSLVFNSASAAPSFSGLITVNSGGVWDNSSNNVAVAIKGGGITNNSTVGNFKAGTSSATYTFSTGAAQALGGILSIPTISVSTGTTLTNNATLTVSNSLSGAGNFTQGSSSTLNFGGSSIGLTGTLDAHTNTNLVNYTANSATVFSTTYSSLTLSGTGASDNVTLQSGTTAISGNLTLSGTVSVTTVANLAISGNLVVGDGTTLTPASTYSFTVGGTTSIGNPSGSGTSGTLTISSTSGTKTFTGAVTVYYNGTWNNSGNVAVTLTNGLTNNGTFTTGTNITTIGGAFSNSGTFTTGTGTVAFNGTTTMIESATTTFYNVSITGTLTAPNATINVSGATWANTGTFTAGTGTVAFTGTGTQTISGTTSFYNLTDQTPSATLKFTSGTTQTILSGGTLTLAGNTTSGNSTFLTVTSSSGSSVANITFAGTPNASITNCNISWITNTSAPISAASSTNSGNNTNITFTNGVFYWRGAYGTSGTGTWATGAFSTSSTSGSSCGYLPGIADSIVFDANSGTAPITVTLSSSLTFRGLSINNLSTGGGVIFSNTGSSLYAIIDTNLTVNNSQVTFSLNSTTTGNNVTIGKSITFLGSNDSIVYPSATNGYTFTLGDGTSPFYINNPANGAFGFGNQSLSGSPSFSINYSSSSNATMNFNANTPSIWAFSVVKGTLTLGSSIKVASVSFNSGYNNQILAVASGATLNLGGNNTSHYTNNGSNSGGLIDATVGNIIISSLSSTVLNNGVNMFKNAQLYSLTINTNSGDLFSPFQALTVTNLTLTSGIYNNSTNNVTIASGGTITRSSQYLMLTAAPIYGSSSSSRVNVTIGATCNAGYELQGITGTVGTLTVNNGSTYTLSSTFVTGYTSLTAGSGYTSNPSVTISAPNITGGTTATASASQTSGGVTYIYITNPGSGYTTVPTITFSGGGGTTQATATATISTNSSLYADALSIAGTLNFANTTSLPVTLNIGGGITIASTGSISASNISNAVNHILNVGGNIANSGSISMLNSASNKAIDVTLNGSSQSLTGTGSNAFNNFYVGTTSPSTTPTVTIPAISATSVTVNSGSTLALGGTLTSSAITINGTLQLNSSGSVSSAPTYNSTSTLSYNNGTSAANGTEWSSSNPYNVTINSGTTFTPTGDLTLLGNWSNAGTFTANSHKITFGGSASGVTITNSNGGTETFYGLTINNSNGVTLGSNVNVTSLLTLTSGILTTTGYTLNLVSTATTSGGSSSAYISGPMTYTLPSNATGSAATYTFPLGATVSSTATYMGFAILNPTTGSGTVTFTATANGSGSGSIGSVDGTLSSIGGAYWSVSSANFTSANIELISTSLVGSSSVVAGYNGTNFTSLGGTYVSPEVTSTATASNSYTSFAVGTLPLFSLGTIVPTSLGFSQSNTTGYYGQTITINGYGFTIATTTVSIGGVDISSSISSTTNTAITLTLPTNVSTGSGQILQISQSGTNLTNNSFNALGYISTGSGDWNSTTASAPWLGGFIPASGSTVTINSAITANDATATTTPPNNVTINSGNSLTFGASGSITTSALTNAGTLSMASGGTLNLTSGTTLSNSGTFTTSSSAGTVSFAGAGSITGTMPSQFYNLSLGGAVTLSGIPTIYGTLTYNSGASLNQVPTYTTNAILYYKNTTATIGTEWGTGSTVGAGVPQYITIDASADGTARTVITPSAARTCIKSLNIISGYLLAEGNLTFSSGATLNVNAGDTLDMGTNTMAATVGNFTNTGTGGIKIGGLFPYSYTTPYTWSGSILFTSTTSYYTIYPGNYNNIDIDYSTGANRNLDAGGGVGTGTFSIAGTMKWSGTGSIAANKTTVSFGASAIVPSGITFYNLSFSGSSAPTISGGTGTSILIIGNAFTPGSVTSISSGTVNFAVVSGGGVTEGNQTIPAFNYNNLTISGSRTTNNVILAASGTIGVAGVFSYSPTYTTGSLTTTGSTINFNGSGQTIPSFTYNNLTNTSSGTSTLGGTVTVNGNLTNASGTLACSSYTLNISGNFTNSGTFTAGTGTVYLNGITGSGGTNQSIPSGLTFYNLTISNSNVTIPTTVTVSGLLKIDPGSGNILTQPVNTTIAASGGLNVNSGTFSIVGNTSTLASNTASSNNAVFQLTGGTPTITGTLAIGGYLYCSTTTAYTMNTGYGFTVASNGVYESANASPALPVATSWNSNSNLYLTGIVGGNPSNISQTFGNVVWNSTSQTGNLSITGLSNIAGSFIVLNTGTGSVRLNNATNTYGNLQVGGSTTINGGTVTSTAASLNIGYSTAGATTVSGSVTIGSNGTLAAGTSGTSLSVAGNWNNSGIFTYANTTVIFNGSSTIGGSVTTTFNNITISGSLTAPTTMNVVGNWTNNGTFNSNTGTVNLTGTSQTISGSSSFYNLVKTVSSAATLTLTSGTTQTITNLLTLTGTSGQLLTITTSTGSSSATINPSSATVTFASISYITNSNSSPVYAFASTNGGNNTNIIFNTYTWTGATSTDYTAATNWSPSRTTAYTSDILTFNNGSSNIVTNVPTQTIYQLTVSGASTTVNLQAGVASNVLTIAGDNNTGTYDLTVAATDSLNLIGSNELIIRLGTNATADILGNIRLDNAIQVLDATYNSGAVINFESGATCQTGANFPAANSSSNYPFTNSSINDNARVVFKSGSKYYNNGGNTPIGGGGTVQSTSFQTGSIYYHQQSGTAAYQMGVFSVSQAHTFGIFVWNNASTSIGTAGSASTTTFDSIAVLQGSFGSTFNNSTGYTTLNLNKGIYIATGARLVLGSTTNATVLNFQGSAQQYINGGGNLILGNTSTSSSTNPYTISIMNTSGVVLQDSLSLCSTSCSYTGLGSIDVSSSAATLYFLQTASITIPSVYGTTYGNLVEVIGSSNTLSLSGNTTITGNLILNSGILDATTLDYSITLAGNFTTNSQSSFNARNATVTLNGGNQTIAGVNTFYNLRKTLTTATSATLTLPSGTSARTTITNSLTLNGYGTTGLLTLNASVVGTPAYITPPSTVSLSYLLVKDNNSLTVLTPTNSSSLGDNTNWYFGPNIWVGTTDTKWTTATNWSKGYLPLSGDTVLIATTTSNQLTLDAPETISSLNINDGNNVTIGTNALTVSGTTTIGNGSSGSLIISSNATTSSFGGTVTLNAGATWNNSGNANVTLSGALVNAGTFIAGSGTTSIGGSLTNTGTFNQSSGTFNFTGTGSSSIVSTTGSYTTNFYNLTLSGTKTITTGGATFGINNNLSISDGTELNLANTYVTVGGTTTVGNGTSGELYISSSSGTKTFTGDVTVNAGGTLLNSGSGNIYLGGSLTNNGTFTSTGSTLTMTATSSKAISGSGTYSFGSLVFNGIGGSWTFPSGQSVAGIFTITNGTFTAPSTLTLNSTFTNNGTFNANGGTMIFASNLDFYGVATTFNNITVNSGVGFATGVNGCTVVGNIVNNGTFANTGGTINFASPTNSTGILSGSGTYNFNSVVISANSYLTAPSNMNISGSYTNNGTYYNNGGTVTFTATGTVTYSGNLTAATNGAFNNVTFSSTGTYQFASSADILGNFNNSSTGTVKATAAVTISVGGTWNNSGTFTNTNTTINFNGTSAQTIPATSFNNLTITNSAGVTLSGNVSVAGVLAMNAGLLYPSSYTLTVTSSAAGAVTGGSTSSYVNGALTRAVVASTSNVYIFPVGNGGAYLADTITSTSAAGNITVTPTASSSGGSYDGSLASVSTNEYWTVNSSVANTVTLVVRPTSIGTNGVLAQSSSVSGTYSSDGGFVTSTSIGAPSVVLASGNNYFVVAKSIIAAPTITAVVSCVTGTNSIYARDTLTLTGTNFQTTSTVSVGGYTTTILSTAGVPTSLQVLVSSSANSNTIAVNNQGGTTTYSTANGNAIATFNVGYVSRYNGYWNTAATWLGGAVPSSYTNITINNVVSMEYSVSGLQNITVNAGDSLKCSNIGMTFNTGAVITNNGTITSANTMTFNGTLTVAGSNATQFSSMTLNGATTFTTAPLITGYMQFNAGSSLAGNPPNYGPSAGGITYNQGGTVTPGLEWTAGATSGSGVPYRVNVNNGTTLNLSSGTYKVLSVFNLDGNVTSSGGSLDLSTASLWFQGTAANSSINIGTAQPNVSSITMGTSYGATLACNINVTGGFTFNTTGGILTTSASHLLTIASTGYIGTGSSTNYINGPLAKAVTSTTASVFPIGIRGVYQPVTLTYSSTPSSSEVVTITPSSATIPGTLPTNVSTVQFDSTSWNIAQTVPSYNYTLGINNGGISNTSGGSVVMGRREGIGSYTVNATSFASPTYTNTSAFFTDSTSNDVFLAETNIPLTITGAVANNKPYDGTTAGSLATVGTLNGILGSDAVSLSSETLTFSSKNVGTGISVISEYEIAGTNAGAYSLSQPSLSANITALPLTITANDQSKNYGTTLSSTSTQFTSSGLLSGETIGSVTLNYSGGGASSAAAGTYSIIPSNPVASSGNPFSASNYNITYVDGTLTVNVGSHGIWTGIASTNFNNVLNWADGEVPSAGDNVIINTGVPYYPVLVSNDTIGSLVYASGTTLGLGGDSLTITGDIEGAGTLTSTSTSSLILNDSIGIINFTSGNNTIENLTLNTGASATLGGQTLIASDANAGTVTIGSGATLNTGGHLVLLSDSLGTASIAQLQGTLSGNVTVQRYISAKTERVYTLVGSPVTESIHNAWQQQVYITGAGSGGSVCGSANSNGFDVTATNTPSMYTYDSVQVSGSRWVSVPNTSGNLTPGVGYRMNIRGDRTLGSCANELESNSPAPPTADTLSATGKVDTGNVVVALHDPLTHLYTLVANPYPSTMSFTSLYLDNDGSINNNMWTYSPFGNGNYTTYSSGTLVNGASGYGGLGASGDNIASGQAFFVQAANPIANSASITFQESDKVNTVLPNTQYFGGAVNKLLRVGLKTTSNTNLDEIVVRFRSNGSAAYNAKVDAASLDAGSQVLVALKAGNKVAIATYPDDTNADTAQLGVSSVATGAFRLVFSDYAGIDSSKSITLVDNFLGTTQDVRTNQVYDFNVTSNTASQGNNRFVVVFGAGTSPLPVSFASITATKNNDGVAVNWSVANQLNIANYEVERSTDGSTFASIANEKASAKTAYSVEDKNIPTTASTLYYRIKSIGEDGSYKYSSIVEVKLTTHDSRLTIFPNPVQDKLNITLGTAANGTYKVRIITVAGVEAFSKTGIAANGNTITLNASNLAGGVYMVELTDELGNKQIEKFVKN